MNHTRLGYQTALQTWLQPANARLRLLLFGTRRLSRHLQSLFKGDCGVVVADEVMVEVCVKVEEKWREK